MSNDYNTFAVCSDCCASLPLTNTDHTCLLMMRRRMVERMIALLDECEDGRGMLWLVRVIYREHRKICGIEMYADRAAGAALARRVCALLEAE